MTKMISTVAQKWYAFAVSVLPDPCPAIQHQEMRRAFYAGAWAMFNLTSHEITALDDDAGVQALEALRRECLTFRERVERGEA
jgi:hypothetical protein